jgi:hypothetical protein
MLANKPCSTLIEANLESEKVFARFGEYKPLSSVTSYCGKNDLSEYDKATSIII